jgi:DNA invertase Pin-like site-specific DNA recombinase
MQNIIPEAEEFCIFDEGISAWSRAFASRPGGSEIIKLASRGDHVICYSIDRLCRNLRDFCNVMHHFESNGISVHFISNQLNTATSSGKLQANILAAMAQYSSDITSERTREALLIKRLREGGKSNIKPKTKWLQSEYALVKKVELTRPTGVVHTYQRVSTEPQYVSGLGLKFQETANDQYAKSLAAQLGCPLGNTYSDPAISAFSIPFSQRPAGSKLMAELNPGDDVVIYRMDRGWRNTLDAMKTIAEIQNKGAYVHFVCERIRTDTGQGREWIALMAAIAQLESQMKSNKISEALARCRATGRSTGTARFGFKAEQVSEQIKKLVVDPKYLLKAGQVWVMKKELGLTTTQTEDMLIAIEARYLQKPANLKMAKRIFIHRMLNQIEIMAEMIGDSLWEKWKQKGRESLKRPFREEHLRLIRRWKWTHSDVIPSISKPKKISRPGSFLAKA